MTRLSDLVHRSSLRSRAAGDAEVSSFSPQVFEVTDLLIPAGTDWSAAPHVLGSFSLAVGDVGIVSFVLEIAEPLGGEVTVDLSADLPRLVPVLDPSFGRAQLSPVAWGNTSISDVISVGAGVGYNDGNEGRGTVVLETSGGSTPADITIIRARAAFLVI